ncbi:hypothetical protein IEO21_05818 [Rhodonia placenta]|uniref:Uncharacterized protein n=1 Tax=Rhodonia placenta TaxID=104341 RepID=A0A8H7P177_9APHY|nr:hypothetical protein IEO21_05818 [Postia placenta]
MTTWAYAPDMHPWFRTPSLKRKSLDDDDISIVECRPQPPVPPRAKRRRYEVLENGFARLTLSAAADGSYIAPQNSDVTMARAPTPKPSFGPAWESYSPPVLHMDPPPTPVVRPSAIEEPMAPEQVLDLPDVRMKVPSWYEIEKDRIVITDLEDSDNEEQEQGAASQATASLSVSPALLDRLSKHAATSVLPQHFEPDPSKALVLFRPLVASHPSSSESSPVLGQVAIVEEVQEGDAYNADVQRDMQIDDPMDIDMT